MSNTKGSMLISNANAVGTELVNQLGGTGYKPSEWSDAINLLGISDDDKASALAGITEGTYTGTERGAIKYSNCNAVGAMLNKKFSTNRGFKPVEWESAISKLTPLAEGTVSGSICNIVNGADQVSLKNWLVTLPASLDGYSEVNAVRSGKNLFDKNNPNVVNGYIDTTAFNTGNQNAVTVYIPIKGGETYTVSKTAGLRFSVATSDVIPSNGALYTSRKANNTASSLYITAGENDKYLWAWVYLGGTDTGTLADMLASIQIEVGSTATSYEAYSAPTQYMASLESTIYGGVIDLVSGTGTETHVKIDLGDFTWVKVTSGQTPYFSTNAPLSPAYVWRTQNNNVVCNNYSYASIGSSGSDEGFFVTDGSYVRIRDANTVNMTVSEFKEYITGTQLVYEIATPTDFTFTPITPTPETALGVNNFWADEGDSSITYRKDPDIPDIPVQLLNMNNNENNNNEGV